jgi:tetrahydromethanopterin S-methyltransferase subunit F
VDTVVDAIKAKTDLIGASVALETGGNVAAIKAKTDNLPGDPADESSLEAAITNATSPLATAAALATVAGYVDTEVASILAAVDTEVAAIKAKTDLIGASVALESGGNIASIKTVVDNIHDTDLPAVKADTAAILLDTGTDGVVVNASGLAADAVDEILDEVVEGTITLRQAIRLCLSALAGKSTGGGSATLTFRDIADSKARITATVDVNGNRTAIVRDGT